MCTHKMTDSSFRRAFHCFLILLLLVMTTPCQSGFAGTASTSNKSAKVKPFVLNHVKARPIPSLLLVKKGLSLPPNPTDSELSQAHILPERLVPTSTTSIAGENAALSKALIQFSAKKNLEDISDLAKFIEVYPNSRWIAGLEFNLGILRLQTGYLSEAIGYWSSCWQKAKREKGANQQAFATRAEAELAALYARLGRADDAKKCLDELKSQKFFGGSDQLVRDTRDGLSLMKTAPQNSFKCGPFALNTLLSLKSGSRPCVNPALRAFPSTSKGTNLAQVHDLAKQVGLEYQIAKKSHGAPLLVPSVAHFRTDHFAAITAAEHGKFRVQDPTFGSAASAWLSAAALDAEGDGYFLVPDGPLPEGWRPVEKEEAQSVWGKGDSAARNPCKPCEEAEEQMSSCQTGTCGMAIASALSMNATVHIVDTPLESSPPIGPNMDMTLAYNVAEGNQPAVPFFANVSENWSLNWISYVRADVSSNLNVSVPGGGFEIYVNHGGSTPYDPDVLSQAVMVPLSGGGYQRILPDGAVQNYTLTTLVGSSYYSFMTSFADAQGNAATVSYDSDLRVTSVTDASGNATTFSYVSNTPSNSGFFVISFLSDAFGRSASLGYDPTTHLLTSITDAVGNVSSFTYAASFGNPISSMTTPYGTTTFTEITNLLATVTGWTFTFPDSSQAVIENFIGTAKDTYYWDREAMAMYPSDWTNDIYSHCKRTHWLWEPSTNWESAVPAWVQKPLETMTYYSYPGQPDSNSIGSINKPNTATRMLAGNRVQLINVFGSGVTPGEVATITVCDQGLPTDAQESVSYTIQSGDTSSSIAAALVTLLNANSNLSALGISARSYSYHIVVQSLSPNPTSYFQNVVGNPSYLHSTDVLEVNMMNSIGATAIVDGTATAGDVLTVTLFDSGLTGGQKAINYTVQTLDDLPAIAAAMSTLINSDTDLQTIGVSSTVSGSAITLNSLTINTTTYQSTVSSGASETFALSYNSQTWQSQYNSIGNITQKIDPVGRTFSYSYDTNKIDLLEQRETQGADNFLMGHWEYNDSSSPHCPTLFVDGSGQQTSYAYNALKELETRTDANGDTTTRSYDSAGYLTQVDGPLTGTDDVTNFNFFGYGLVHTITDSEGYQLIFSYDALNRKTKTEFPDGTFEPVIYDKLDAVLSADRLGRWTLSSFDSMDQLVESTDPLGRKTKYSWCVCGGLASMTDPLGQTTSLGRDLQGRMTSKTYQDGTATLFAYEPINGRLLTRTDAAGQITNYQYFPDNMLAQRSYANGYLSTGPTSYTYDPAFPRLLTADNSADWGSILYSYNAYVTSTSDPAITGGGKLASVTNINNYYPNSTVNYSYDNLGRTSNRTVSGTSNSATWSFDAMSRLTNEVNELGTFNYNYIDDTSGSSKGTTRLSSIEYPNGQVTNFGYYGNEGDHRLKQISNLNGSSETISQFILGYNSAGEIKQWPQILNGKSTFNSIDYDDAGQLLSVKGSDGSPGKALLNQNYYFYDNASNISGLQANSLTRARISGTISSGDILTVVVHDPALTFGPEFVNLTVQSGDTLASVAAELAAAITADSQLQAIGVNAAASSNVLTIQSVSQNITTFSEAGSSGATEIINLGVSDNFIELLSISGTKNTGDAVTIEIYDAALSGGHEDVAYTVQSGDSLPSIASGLKTAINGDTALQAIGVSATSAATIVSISSTSTNATTYAQTTSTGATEVLSLSVNPNGFFTIGILGSPTTSDSLTVHVFDSALTGGTEAVSYVVQSGDTLSSIASGVTAAINANTNLQGLALSATTAGSKISVLSNSNNLTTYRQTVSSGATELMLAPLPQNGTQTAAITGSITTGDGLTLNVFDTDLSGGSESVNYTIQSGDTLETVAAALATAINANTNLQTVNVSANAVASVVNIESDSKNATTYSQSASSGATESLFLAPSVGSTQFFCNNVNELTNTSPGGPVRVHATTNKALSSATVDLPNISLNAPSINTTTYAGSGSGSESITFGTTTNGLTVASLAGTVASGDVISLTVYNSDLGGGSVTESYTAQSGDTLFSVADALSSAINLDPLLQAVGQTAKAAADAHVKWSKSFSGDANLQPGNNSFSVSATDGGNNSQTDSNQIGANSGTPLSWIYDAVGNFSYGPNQGYSFDPENRFQQLDIFTPTTPGTYYDHDALGRCVAITTYENAVVTSRKIYVWSGDQIIQEQDDSGNVTKDYFAQGENRGSTNYFYTRDHLGSIRELTDDSGNIQAQYSYDPYGRPTKIQGALDCDFQYAGYFYEATSGFNLTRYRAYSPNLGRWISRDPLSNKLGSNLTSYCLNNPLTYKDSLGLYETVVVNGNSVTIDMPTTYAGEGAGRTQAYNDSISNYWTGQFGKYNVKTKARPVCKKDKNCNFISIPIFGLKPTTDKSGQSGVWPIQGMDYFDQYIPGNWSGTTQMTSWSAAHEAGHLMGLDDSNGSGIMNQQNIGKPPTEEEITQIIKLHCN